MSKTALIVGAGSGLSAALARACQGRLRYNSGGSQHRKLAGLCNEIRAMVSAVMSGSVRRWIAFSSNSIAALAPRTS